MKSSDTTTITGAPMHNEALFQIAERALTSHKESCDAKLIFMDHDGRPEWSQKARELCERLGYRYHYMEEYFNAGKYSNWGTHQSETDVYTLTVCGIKFYPGWIDNILAWWDKHPNCFSMHPVTYETFHLGLQYVNHKHPEKRIAFTNTPPGWIFVMKKSKGPYVWDEFFSHWEIDADYWYWLKANGKTCGICYDALVEHYIGAVRNATDKTFSHEGQSHESMIEARRYLERKWNLPRPV